MISIDEDQEEWYNGGEAFLYSGGLGRADYDNDDLISSYLYQSVSKGLVLVVGRQSTIYLTSKVRMQQQRVRG